MAHQLDDFSVFFFYTSTFQMNFVSDSSYESIICGQRVALGRSSVNQILRCNEFTEALSSLWLLGGHLVGLFY